MDLDSLFNRAFDGFGSDPEPGEFPGVPGSSIVTGNGQAIADTGISRCSRISRSGNGGIGSDNNFGSEKTDFLAGVDRAREVPFKAPGNTGTPGNEGKSSAESTSLQFPVKDKEPGTPGTESAVCGRPVLDLNSAAPQRSDWWSGAAMAEVDRLAPPAEPLPIAADEVRAGVERELRALAEDGREGPPALRDAVEITRAKLRNSEILAERQMHAGRCHVCGEPLDDSASVVAVLSGKPPPWPTLSTLDQAGRLAWLDVIDDTPVDMDCQMRGSFDMVRQAIEAGREPDPYGSAVFNRLVKACWQGGREPERGGVSGFVREAAGR